MHFIIGISFYPSLVPMFSIALAEFFLGVSDLLIERLESRTSCPAGLGVGLEWDANAVLVRISRTARSLLCQCAVGKLFGDMAQTTTQGPCPTYVYSYRNFFSLWKISFRCGKKEILDSWHIMKFCLSRVIIMSSSKQKTTSHSSAITSVSCVP